MLAASSSMKPLFCVLLCAGARTEPERQPRRYNEHGQRVGDHGGTGRKLPIMAGEEHAPSTFHFGGGVPLLVHERPAGEAKRNAHDAQPGRHGPEAGLPLSLRTTQPGAAGSQGSRGLHGPAPGAVRSEERRQRDGAEHYGRRECPVNIALA